MSEEMRIEGLLAKRGPENKKYIIRLTKYMKHRLLDLRFWYKSRKHDEYRMTKKGIMLSRQNYLLTLKTLSERYEEILDWFGIGYVPERVIKYRDDQDNLAENATYKINRCDKDSQANCEYHYEVEHYGGKSKVILNKNSALCDAISKLDDIDKQEVENLLAGLFLAFEYAIKSIDFPLDVDQDILASHIKFQWSQYIEVCIGDKDNQ